MKNDLTKQCTKCGEEKPLMEFGSKPNRGLPRLNTRCRACSNAQIRKWRAASPEAQEKQRQHNQSWATENRDRVLANLAAEAEMADPTKVCRMCGERKPRPEFHKRLASLDGRDRRCKPCALTASKAQRAGNPVSAERQRQGRRQWRTDNRERISKQKALKYQENKEVHREKVFRRKYGISTAEKATLFQLQGGKCAVCEMEYPLYGRDGLHVDHDHESGEVRGLLCQLCNMVLGLSRDNAEVLRKAVAYLHSPPAKRTG